MVFRPTQWWLHFMEVFCAPRTCEPDKREGAPEKGLGVPPSAVSIFFKYFPCVA